MVGQDYASKKYKVGIDVGGTFTDLVALDEQRGEMISIKVETTPDNPAIGFIEALKKTRINMQDISRILHSSTTTTNALVTRTGAKTGLITTEGFRDILEMQRCNRQLAYDLQWTKPRPLVPRHLRKEVPERMNHAGEILKPLDEEKARQAVRELKGEHVDAIAVCFLFSFANPKHEIRMKQIVQEEFPEVYVCTSYEVAPEYREYERTNTVVMNACVGRVMRQYAKFALAELGKLNYKGDLLMVHSGGGVTSIDTCIKRPVITLLSGAAAGMVGAAHLSQLLGHQNAITLDIGGTTTLAGCVYKGDLQFSIEGEVEWGLPVRMPMVDVASIGNGGGSIAWVDAGGTLRVGPMSAAAVPGPACYGKGGTEATITDANMLLRILNPDYFLGGEMKVYPALSQKAIDGVASKLGLNPIETASGIRSVAAANLEQAIRQVSLERGYDPRDFVLIAFGGNGPLFAANLLVDLGIPTAIIPITSTLSAAALLVMDLRHDLSRAHLTTITDLDTARINDIYRELDERASAALRKDGYEGEITRVRSMDLRYLGEAYELTITVPSSDGELSQSDMKQVLSRFHDEHRRSYGHSKLDEPVELVGCRFSAIGKTTTTLFRQHAKGSQRPDTKAVKSSREVWFDAHKPEEAMIYERSFLRPGNIIAGPAIIEQMDTMTVVPRGIEARIDTYLNIVMSLGGK